jgi:hypothetical protein
MTMRRETWQRWLIGLAIGAAAGLAIAVFGAPLLVLSLASLALALVADRSVVLLSGALVGTGGLWLALLVRAQLACDAFDAAPNQGCDAPDVGPLYLASAIVLGLGLICGALAWHRRRLHGPRPDLP